MLSSILLALATGYLLLFILLRIGFRKALNSELPRAIDSPPLSVVVPAKNEKSSIVRCLQSISRCDYPGQIEVIVIDSKSTDGTFEAAVEFSLSDEANNVVSVMRATNGDSKLAALFEGIEKSGGEIILTTDSDCTVGMNWLRGMVSEFREDVGIVAGPVVYENVSDNLFGRVQTLEFAGLVGAGAATLGLGIPSICNSANLAYRSSVFHHFKDRFLEAKFAGADETMLQSIKRELSLKPVFCRDRDAVVVAHPVESLADFVKQRVRWASGPINFPSPAALSLSLFAFSFYLLLLLGPLLVWTGFLDLKTLLWALGLKVLADALFLSAPVQHFRLRDILNALIPFELVHIPYVIFASLVGTLNNLFRPRKGVYF